MKRKKISREKYAVANRNEHKCSNDQGNCSHTPEFCLVLLNKALSVVNEPKENFVCNQLNIKPLNKPSDFSYDNNSDSFILQIDVSILKAASDYLKQSFSRPELLLNVVPLSDISSTDWQNASKSSDIYSQCLQLPDNLGQNEIILLNSDNAISHNNLINCSINGIHLQYLDIPTEITSEFFSQNTPVISENLKSTSYEHIYIFDFNVGANIVYTDESHEQLPECIDSLSIASPKIKKNNSSCPRKQSCRRNVLSKNKSCIVSNDDSCDRKGSKEIILKLSAVVPDKEKHRNKEISPKIHKQLDTQHASPVIFPNDSHHTKRKRNRCIWDTKKRRCKKKNAPLETKCAETIEPNLNTFCDTCDEDEELNEGNKRESLEIIETKRSEILKTKCDSYTYYSSLRKSQEPFIDSSTTLSDVGKRVLEAHKEFEANASSTNTVSVDAGFDIDCQQHNLKRKRKRSIWDTKKRKFKKKTKPLKEKNIDIVPIISELFCDTCDEENISNLTFDDDNNLFNVGQISVGENLEVDPNLKYSQLSSISHEPETEKLFGISKRDYFRLLELQEKTGSDSQLCSSILQIPVTNNEAEANLDDNIPDNSSNYDSRALVGEKLEIPKSLLENKSVLETVSSLNQNKSPDICQTTKTKVSEVTEQILYDNKTNDSTCEVDETEVFDGSDSVILKHTESSGKESSKISSNFHISNVSGDNILSSELILIEDDLDFEPDSVDQSNTENPSNSQITDIPSCNFSPRSIVPVNSNTVSDKIVPVLENSDSEEVYPQQLTNFKICNELTSGLSVKPSFHISQTIDSPLYFNFPITHGVLSQKRNVPSDDDSDSDHEYNFKRSRRERKSAEALTSNYNTEEFNINKVVSAAQNEIIQSEIGSSSPFGDFRNTTCSSNLSKNQLQDVVSPSDSSLRSSKSDKAIETSVESQVPLDPFYCIDDVVSKIKSYCDKNLVIEAVEIAQTYMAVSCCNDDNALLMQELFSSVLPVINSSNIIDVSIISVVDKLFKIIQDYNICNRVVSEFINKCCSNTALHIYAIKMFHCCQERNILLRSAAIKVFGSFLKSEDICLNVLLDFLEYIKSVCNKKIPRDLLHMVLKKCKDSKGSSIDRICLLLHNITVKELDTANLQEFLMFCFEHEMWEQIASMFIAWSSRYDLLGCLYYALASTNENVGIYFKKFADSLLHGHDSKVSSYQVYCIGQMGTALLLVAFKRCDLQPALEVLYTLHAHNINYFEQALNSCKLYADSCENTKTALTFPFHLVFTAIDVCFHFKRPKDAFSIFHGFSWIVPDESLCSAVKKEVINQRFKRLLKLVLLLNIETSLKDGWEALKMLLLTIEQDFTLENLKLYATDLQNIYNNYLASFMNLGKISSVRDLYQHSLGPCKQIFQFAPVVLRGLVVTFVKNGMLQDASSLFMFGIIKEVYCMEKPKPDGYPWLLTLMTNWTVQEMRLAVDWFLEALLPLLTDKRVKTDFEKWFSLKIAFKISTQNCSKVHCVKVSGTDQDSAAKRAIEAFKHLNPSLEIIQEAGNNFCITPDSVYNFWKFKCTSASPILPVFTSNFLESEKKVYFGRDNTMPLKEISQTSIRDSKNSRDKQKALCSTKHFSIFEENQYVKSHNSEFLKHSQFAENIVSGMIGKIRANVSTSPADSSVSSKNASYSTSSDNFYSQKVSESQDYLHQQSTFVKLTPKFSPSSFSKSSIPSESNIKDSSNYSDGYKNASLEKFNSPNKFKQNIHYLNSRFSQDCSSRSGTNGKSLTSNINPATSSSINESHFSNVKICDDFSKKFPIKYNKRANQFNHVSYHINSSSGNPINLVSNSQNYIKKSKTVTSSVEAPSNFHVVRISNEILLAPDHKNISNSQKKNPNLRPLYSGLSQDQKCRVRLKRAKFRASIWTSTSANPRVCMKEHNSDTASLKDNTITKASIAKIDKNPGKSFSKQQKFQNITISFTPSASLRTISNDNKETSSQNKHSSSPIIPSERTSQGESICNKEEFCKIIQFLKIKVIQKYKNLTTAEQHRKAMALAETFLMNNNVKAVDKKIMKRLTEFAISNI